MLIKLDDKIFDTFQANRLEMLKHGYLRCSKCHEFKLIEEFSPSQKVSKERNGKHYNCRICCRELERMRDNTVLSNGFKHARMRILKKTYGITIDEFTDEFKKQNGKCAICKNELLLYGFKSCHVDHNHITKKFRGILCDYCNRGLGQFRENIEVLEAAIKYLSEER